MKPYQIRKRALECLFPREKMQVENRQSRFTYVNGPMYFLGQQIVKQMEDAGYPAKIVECYRTFERQQSLYDQGRTKPGKIVTKAKPGQSAHNYLEAVDIVHPSKGWEVSPEYWDALARAVRIVGEKYRVILTHGHSWGWDSAHIELSDWRDMRDEVGLRRPSPEQLAARFEAVLPSVWRRYKRGKAGQHT